MAIRDLNGAPSSGYTVLTLLTSDGTQEYAIDVSDLSALATAPIAKPSVTGSKGANAALTSLCTQLAALGLITDGTS